MQLGLPPHAVVYVAAFADLASTRPTTHTTPLPPSLLPAHPYTHVRALAHGRWAPVMGTRPRLHAHLHAHLHSHVRLNAAVLLARHLARYGGAIDDASAKAESRPGVFVARTRCKRRRSTPRVARLLGFVCPACSSTLLVYPYRGPACRRVVRVVRVGEKAKSNRLDHRS